MDAAHRYLLLGLRLGRHVDGLVDAYFGPPELSARVDAEPLAAPRDLVADADALVAELEDGWLLDQARGLRTYAGVLAGEGLSYSEEVEGCYGISPGPPEPDAYAAAHARLDAILPAGDSLLDRYADWQLANTVPADRVAALLGDVVAILREQADAIVPLPEGERVELEGVHDEPWWAVNYYRGGLLSNVVVNLDVATTTDDLVELAAHEVYPGHHTERVQKERLLVEERGLVEETILLVPTPQSIVCEGIAETGPEFVFGEPTRSRLIALFEREGLAYDVEEARAVREARRPLRRVGVDAAVMLNEHGADRDEVQAYIERWALSTPAQAVQSIRFVTDPTWRAYTIAYSAGRRLCSAYVGGDPALFRTLLTEQVRIGDLHAAVSSGE
jgi:hypothetical protein